DRVWPPAASARPARENDRQHRQDARRDGRDHACEERDSDENYHDSSTVSRRSQMFQSADDWGSGSAGAAVGSTVEAAAVAGLRRLRRRFFGAAAGSAPSGTACCAFWAVGSSPFCGAWTGGPCTTAGLRLRL